MDIIEKLVIEVFENRQDYSDLDYLTIMNILKESYLRFNGDMPTQSKALEEEEEQVPTEDEDLISYSNYYSDENEGYLSDYIESY